MKRKKLYAVQQGGHSIKHKVSLLVSFCVPSPFWPNESPNLIGNHKFLNVIPR